MQTFLSSSLLSPNFLDFVIIFLAWHGPVIAHRLEAFREGRWE